MSTTPVPNKKPLQGQAFPTVDAKNRVTIPADWREIIGGNEIHLMPSTAGDCLKMLPPVEMDRLRESVNALVGPKRTAAQRRIGYDSRLVYWDGQGRCVIPDEFCKRLNLTGEVVMNAGEGMLEIWNAAKWEAAKPMIDEESSIVLSSFGI